MVDSAALWLRERTKRNKALWRANSQSFVYIELMNTPDLESWPSVLVEFRATNARSFKGEVRLSMVSTTLSEPQFVRKVPWREGGRLLSILPVAGVFGANASGKSNLLEIMHDMRRHVLYSFRHGRPGGGMSRKPYLLDQESTKAPSRFEIEVVVNGVLHWYGFALDDERVIEEWAYRYPKGKAARLFNRDEEGTRLGPTASSKGRAVLDILRPNALFLSTAASANHPDLLPLYNWFENNLLLADAETYANRITFTAAMLDDERCREAVLGLLKAADLGITGARQVTMDTAERERLQRFLRVLHEDEESDEEHMLSFDPVMGVNLIHLGENGEFEMDEDDESRGTLIWFALAGPVLRALESGSTLLVDELDTSLHPDLAQELLRIFQDPDTNTRGAQLVFNSHDVRLLGDATGRRPLGRDQVWFTEKFNDGTTHLVPLSDFEPRKQEAIAKRYLEGYYGAKPIVSIGDSDAAAELVTVSD